MTKSKTLIPNENENLLLAIDILKYYPTKTAKTLSANFHTAIHYSTDFFSQLFDKKIDLHSSSKLKLADLKKNISPILSTLDRTLALIEQTKKQADALLTEQEKINKENLDDNTFGFPSGNQSNQTAFSTTTSLKRKHKKSNPPPAAPAVNNRLTDLHKNALNTLSKKVLDDFKAHQQVLIPLASTNENKPNAQMLCELRQLPNGEVLLLVWNTGFGTWLHGSKDDSEVDKLHAPVRVFRCANADELNKQHLQAFVERCLAPSLPDFNGTPVEPKDFYNRIINDISFMSGVEIDSAPFYHTGVIAEPEGSSAWKALQIFMQNNGISKENYDEIHYEMLKHTFENILNKYEKVIEATPPLQQEVEEMATLLATKLRKVAKDQQFSIERQKVGLELLKRAKQLTTQKLEKDFIDPEALSRFNRVANVDQRLNHDASHWEQFYATKRQALQDADSTDYAANVSHQFEDLDQLNELMNSMMNGNNPSIKTLIEFSNVLNALPLTDDFINRPHKVQLHDFAETLNKFAETLARADDAKIPFADQQIAIFSAVALLELIANKHFASKPSILGSLYSANNNGIDFQSIFNNIMKSLPGFSQPVLKYLNLIAPDDLSIMPNRHKVFEVHLRSHYLTTTDTYAYERLKRIQSIFRQQPSPEIGRIGIIDVIANEEPSIKQACGRLGNSNDDKKEAGNYVYENVERIAKSHPALYQDASFCLAYKGLLNNAKSFSANRVYRSSSLYGSNYYYGLSSKQKKGPQLGIHTINWSKISYERDSKGILDSSEHFSFYYESNKVENAHSISDGQLTSDLSIAHDEYSPSKKQTPNNIQIKLHAKTIDKKLDLRRVLTQIGVCPESQIVAAIEYLQANATNIETKDIQSIIFMLLFDKGLMAHEIKENPSAILKLLEISASALRFYTLDELKQPVAFYLQINTFLRKVLLSLPRNTQHLDEIIEKSNDICRLHDGYAQQLTKSAQKTESQSELLKSLQALKVLELKTQLERNGNLSEEQLTEFYILNFQLRFAKELVNSPYLNHEVTLAQHAIRAYALATPALTTKDMLLNVTNALDIDFDPTNVRFTFPHARNADTQIDLINATIIKEGAESSPLPREIYANETFKEIFGNDDILAKGISHDSYEFQYKGEHYRLQNDSYYYHNSSLVLQKKMAKEDEAPVWYQLNTSPSRSNIRELFPNNLTMASNWVWESQNGDVIVVDKATQSKKAIYSKNEQAAFLLDENGLRTHRLVSRNVLTGYQSSLSFITNFEDPEHVIVTEDLETHNIHINLIRYGLSFTSKIINGSQYFVCDDDHETCLLATNTSPIAGYNKALVFGSIPKKDKPQKVVKTLLAAAAFDQSVKDQETSKQYTTYYHAGDEFEPAGSADAYYLASLELLLANNTEKGYQLLLDYTHRFLGSSLELTALLSIATMGQVTDENKPEIGNLNRQAAKILSSYVIVQYLRQGHTLEGLVENLKKQHPAPSDTFLEGVKNFKALASKNIKEYLVLKDYIPKTMHLKRRQELSIIDFVKQDQPDFYLDIQNKRRALKNLLKEYRSLLKLNDKPSAQVTDRINVLKETLLQEYHFTPKQTELGSKAYDLTNRDHHLGSNRVVSYSANGSPVKKTQSGDLSIAQLSLTTPVEVFNDNFFNLYNEAANDPAKEEQLHAFINAKLLSIVHSKVAPKSDRSILNFSDNELDKMGLPDFLNNLIKSLNGIKLPEIHEVPPEAKYYSLLKSMLANKAKVAEIVAKFDNEQNKNKYIQFTNSVHDYRSCNNVNEAVAFMLAHQAVTLDIPTLNDKDGKSISMRFVSSIDNINYFNGKISEKVNLTNLDSILSSLGLKEKLTAKPATSSKDVSNNIFALNSQVKEPFYESLINESNEDYHKGKSNNLVQANLQKQWFEQFHNHETRYKLKATIEKTLAGHQSAFDKLQQDILTLLNKGPSDPAGQIEWQLALQAKARKEFTMADAFKFFSMRSLTRMKSKCHLNDDDAKQLLQLTGQYLIEGSQQQQYQRTLAILNKLEVAASVNDRHTLINQLGAELSTRRCYDINKYPDILLFEYLDNKLVYPKQINMLDKLLKQKGDGSYESVAIQLIMGGGKSKVLLPLLAKMRANGTNLTIIEVPGALLETNFYDLHAVSSKLNQNSHLFKFDRNVAADSAYYYRMREHLQSVVANKEYLVTTRESIQSIELKYIDVLTNPIDDLQEWEKQIAYLDDIVNLIKNRGDAILDEIDLNLRTRDQLIYTVGEGKSTPKFITNAIVGLYQMFVKVNHTVNGANINLHDVVTLKSEKPSDDDLKIMIGKLKSELLHSKQSPIAHIVGKLNASELKEVDNFLSNRFTTIPTCLQTMSLHEKSILAVYKEHLNRLLPLSLSRKLYENFGLTQDPLKVGMQKEIAIPYVSNNTPNESAKFQNHLLTMNYTIQTHLARSLSIEVLETLFKDFKSRFTAELNLNAYSKNPTHQVEESFKAMFGDAVDLRTFDINDQVKISRLHSKFKNALNVKEYCLAEYILPSILTNPLTICSNDQNHVSAYRSTVGFTGTDYNYRCFHDSISRDNTDSFGTDGQTISHLINKERVTHVLDKNNSEVLFDLLRNHEDLLNVRAFIDVGAQFKGVSNRDVANQLAAFYFKENFYDIKYVLYFNKDNVLCALKVSEHPEHEEPLVLGSSENIEAKLGCSCSGYFTYYDQAHTTGTDIKQAPGTIGITTVSEKSMLRDVLQAVMRLRDLKDSHHIEFAVMQSLLKEYPTIKNWDVKTILNVCLQYQAKTLMQEHLSAAFNKINNIVRMNIMSQIRNSTSIMDKAILADAYKHMLYEFDSSTYFDKYGTPETMIETENLLKIVQEKAIHKWQVCLENAQKMVNKAELEQINTQMSKVITKSVKICNQKQLTPLTAGGENQVIAQIEVQNERQNEIETQQQVQDARLKERSYKSWDQVDLATYRPGQTIKLMSFEQIANSHKVARNWKFDANLQASENYYETCNSGFSDKLNRFKKPLFYVMSLQVGDQINKILITQQEAQELREKLKKTKLPNDRHIWIDTPSGINYAGICPTQKNKNPREQRLIEQIQFLNADIIYLTANYGSLTWFKENAQEKFNYLQNELLTLHPNKGSSLALLREIMLQDGKLNINTGDNEPNLLTDKSWQKLSDAYFYPEDASKHPQHTKAEYARLQSYTRHRDNVRFYSLRSKFQEYKKAISAFFNRTKTALIRAGANFALKYVSLRTMDYLKSKRNYAIFYSIFSACLGLAQAASWILGLGIGFYIAIGGMITTSIIAARLLWCLHAKGNYDSITKIEKLSNPSELYALKTGLESSTYLGYLKGLFRPTCYLYPKAYYAGLEIGCDRTETVLVDQINRKKI